MRCTLDPGFTFDFPFLFPCNCLEVLPVSSASKTSFFIPFFHLQGLIPGQCPHYLSTGLNPNSSLCLQSTFSPLIHALPNPTLLAKKTFQKLWSNPIRHYTQDSKSKLLSNLKESGCWFLLTFQIRILAKSGLETQLRLHLSCCLLQESLLVFIPQVMTLKKKNFFILNWKLFLFNVNHTENGNKISILNTAVLTHSHVWLSATPWAV